MLGAIATLVIFVLALQRFLWQNAKSSDEALRKAVVGDYRVGRYNYFLVANGFKFAMIVVDLFVVDPTSQGVVALVIVLAMFVATRRQKPYRKVENNNLEAALYIVVCIRCVILRYTHLSSWNAHESQQPPRPTHKGSGPRTSTTKYSTYQQLRYVTSTHRRASLTSPRCSLAAPSVRTP